MSKREAKGMITDSTTPPANDQVICTLFEKDYHLGVAVLINSIVRGGFADSSWVGYRGELPPWTAQLPHHEDGTYKVGEAALVSAPAVQDITSCMFLGSN